MCFLLIFDCNLQRDKKVKENQMQQTATTMRKIVLLSIAFVLFSSHDMFLKLDTHFLQPNTLSSIKLFNGTFEESDNTIDRNRMLDVSLVGGGKRTSVDTTQWTEQDGVTILNFTTGEAGTWVAGVSTRPRNINMSAKDFNNYLEHDGVLDMLEWREANDALDQDATEKYSKHVKTIFQVGEQLTKDWQTTLGYPIEFIPLSNPYDLHPGHELEVQLLWKGKPLANQLVYIGSNELHEHSHDHAEADHSHTHDDHEHHATTMQARTNDEGKLSINITQKGVWYLRTIHLALSEQEGLTHESNWATLTFEVGQGHSHSDYTHSDDHHHEEVSSQGNYIYWIGSLALVLGLFFWFNRRGA